MAITTGLPPGEYYNDVAFVSVDLQEPDPNAPSGPLSSSQMPAEWREMGFSVSDVNLARQHAEEVAHPNAARIAQACRRAGVPRILIHWGWQFADLRDLDPEVRDMILNDEQSSGRPVPSARSGRAPLYVPEVARFLGSQPDDYVISKPAQDAFKGTAFAFLLENLGVHNLIMVGGHTGACLGKTAASAIRLGYSVLCVEDATTNAFESNRRDQIAATGYHYIVTANQLAGALSSLPPRESLEADSAT